MTKRKRSEEGAIDLHFAAREAGQMTQESTDPTAQIAVTGNSLVAVRGTKETTLEVQTGSSVPWEGTGQVADNEEGDGTIWSLMAQAGYMVW